MKQNLLVRRVAWVVAALVLPMSAGCGTSGDSGQIFFNVVWTVLLGITAAGGVVLLRNA
jgi:hypothetical protein